MQLCAVAHDKIVATRSVACVLQLRLIDARGPTMLFWLVSPEYDAGEDGEEGGGTACTKRSM